MPAWSGSPAAPKLKSVKKEGRVFILAVKTLLPGSPKLKSLYHYCINIFVYPWDDNYLLAII
jgi:hypothetical protein